MDGKGVLNFIEGSFLEGQFVNHKVHGKATISFPDGDIY